MPATLSSSGTWTALSTDFTSWKANASPNVPTNNAIAYADLRTVPEEIFRMVELIQEGYQTGSAPNLQRLNFWQAATLLRTWLNCMFDPQTLAAPTSLAAQLR